jgi:hypothetical protein
MIEAVKQTFAIKARPAPARARRARPVMSPVPATRDPALSPLETAADISKGA